MGLTCSFGAQEENKVEITNFVWACLRMKGLATSIDLHSMDFEMRLMHRRQRGFMDFVEHTLEEISRSQQRFGSAGAPAITGAPPSLYSVSQVPGTPISEGSNGAHGLQGWTL